MKRALISIKGSPAILTGDGEIDESFELLTDGEYCNKNGYSTFNYMESELTGLNGLQTTFTVEPDRVVLQRGGGETGDMVFSETQKHHFLYETPFGAITMGIDTHSIKNDMRDDGGNLEIRYNIEVDNITVSQNVFQISIRTQ